MDIICIKSIFKENIYKLKCIDEYIIIIYNILMNH